MGCCHRSSELEAWEPHLLLLPSEDTPLTSHQPCLVLLLSSPLLAKPQPPESTFQKLENTGFSLTTAYPLRYSLGLRHIAHLNMSLHASRAHTTPIWHQGLNGCCSYLSSPHACGPWVSGCPVHPNPSGHSEPPACLPSLPRIPLLTQLFLLGKPSGIFRHRSHLLLFSDTVFRTSLLVRPKSDSVSSRTINQSGQCWGVERVQLGEIKRHNVRADQRP